MCVRERGSVSLCESLFVCYALCLFECVFLGGDLIYMYVLFMSVCNVFVFSVCVGCAVMIHFFAEWIYFYLAPEAYLHSAPT